MKTNEIKCCTPNGQIKRYKDCIGCDRNPLELNQNKMTAVEWLQSGLELIMSHEEQMQAIGLFEQAKEMEKEQIIEAFITSRDPYGISVGNSHSIKKAEQYYNETFK